MFAHLLFTPVQNDEETLRKKKEREKYLSPRNCVQMPCVHGMETKEKIKKHTLVGLP
jgi:hypothetical protein